MHIFVSFYSWVRTGYAYLCFLLFLGDNWLCISLFPSLLGED